ncbi:SpvB/TcaC N-terminal domain-containing protein [Bordetella sp. LUAb4]|uniref:SpvB/TcaC N-terminal domain-containing protein n=1 Tax=Bordetella sp. LUAb4 TaxID=2843195 RepID=UPI001E56723B|nr:SpvB/TcaC N-terminal domain-containing protein [Bordetella sp. LUAb4]
MGRPFTAPAVTSVPPTLPQPGPGGLQIPSVEASPVGSGASTGFSIQLPISPGRGYAPQLALSSGGGNGVFGWDWDAGVPSIQQRYDHGMPSYTFVDSVTQFVGPNGEVLDQYGGPSVAWTPANYSRTGWVPRKEGEFARIIRMAPPSGQTTDFWQINMPDGEVQWFGRTEAGRICDPADATRTAVWLLQESVTPDGQHIYYEYSHGSDANQASRYLTAIHYGNVTSEQAPFLYLADTDANKGPDRQQWLFTLLFDYSTPCDPWQAPAAYDTIKGQTWVKRADPHASYGYGFPVHVDYLCRQVLMYHRLDSNKQLSGSGTPTLISRLWLDYEETPAASRLMGTQRMAYDAGGNWQFLPIIDIEWSADFAAPADASCWVPLDQPMVLPLANATPEHDPILYSESDLYSEGMAGLLHRVGNCWYYRRPVRDKRTTRAPARAITQGPRKLLPSVPLLSGAADTLLMDINGDGCLESVKIGAGGQCGYHSMQADQTWSSFIPVQSLPSEIGAPYAVFGNMHGSGLPDLFVLSPTSVRYYTNLSDDTQVSFSRPRDVAQAAGIVLPIPGRNPREWVNFADVLGSGQPHLVRLRHDSLTYWPWLGDGRFGAPMTMTSSLPFDLNTFDPARVSFLSLFGPQAPDLVYTDVDDIKIFKNRCGNGYETTPVKIPYPEGYRKGNLADIRFSDMAGTGGTSIVLVQPFGNVTVPYGYTGFGATRYWRVDLNTTVPYQLTALDNNMGARSEVSWRSSIQDWVDEKIETNDRTPTNRPSARMVVDEIATVDYVSHLRRISTSKYRDGVWDGKERESRGYRYVEIGQQTYSDITTPMIPLTALAPSVTKTWFHAGRDTDDQLTAVAGTPYFYGSPYVDSAAYTDLAGRYTNPILSPSTDQIPWYDAAFNPQPTVKYWLSRALAGSVLRIENHGAGGVPLNAQHFRWQSRLAAVSMPAPSALPMQLETITYNYEGYATDPLISQTIEMDADRYGYTTWRLDIAYPRRLTNSATNPYTDSQLDEARRIPFPEAGNGGDAVDGLSWKSTFDAQQTKLRITESRFLGTHVDDTNYRLGILQAERQNILTYDDYAAVHPGAAGLHFETFQNLGDTTNLLASGQKRQLLAQSSYDYQAGLPAPLVLLAATHKALLTTEDYNTVIANGMSASDVAAGGYEASPLLLTVPGGAPETDKVYTGKFAINVYNDQSKFWTLASQQSSTLASPNPNPDAFPGVTNFYPITTFTWDENYVLTTSATDPYGSVISAHTIDYRFLAPTTILDPNMNKQQVQLDALGRVIATSFSGTQLKESGNGVVVELVGFDDLDAHPYDGNFDGSGPQNQATRVDYQVYEMMGILGSSNTTLVDRMITARYAFLTGPANQGALSGFVRSRGRAWLATDPSSSDPDENSFIDDLQSFQSAVQPVIFAVQAADTFSTSATPLSPENQQLPLTTTYVDGFNRTLSNLVRVPGGVQAYIIADDGTLSTPAAIPANDWAYAARDYTRFAPDGAALTKWPAFFLKCVSNTARLNAKTRASTFPGYFLHINALPPDQYLYDALAREIQVVTGRISDRTGQPYERRTYYAPWFTLTQDENDIDDERPAAGSEQAEGFIASMARLSRRNRASKKRRSSGRR